MPEEKKIAGMTVEGGVSKITGLIVAVLTIVSVIVGAVFWVVHQNDVLQMQVMVLQEQMKNTMDAVKELNEARRDGEGNFDKMIRIMAEMHDKERTR